MDVSTEIEKRVDTLIKDNNIPMFFRPHLLAAAWIGAGVFTESTLEVLDNQEKDNQILNKVFKNN